MAEGGANSDRPNKILTFISDYGSGGAQRFLQILTGELLARGYNICNYVFIDSDTPMQICPLGEIVKLGQLKKGSIIRKAWHIIKCLIQVRRAVIAQQPRQIISLIDQTNIILLLATIGLKTTIIVSERVYPAKHTLVKFEYSKFTRTLASKARNLIYLLADKIVTQTEAAKAFFPSWLQYKIVVIPNPIAKQNLVIPADKRSNKLIVTFARLHQQKRLDILIKAFRIVSDKHPDWRLEIYGEGALKNELTELISTLKLEKQVWLAGVTDNPSKILATAPIFALTSDFEGFPNALCEAMAAGCAVVSTDCLAGPSDIIKDGINGYLIPVGDYNRLADTMNLLIETPELRCKLGLEAEKITEELTVKKITDRWESLGLAQK